MHCQNKIRLLLVGKDRPFAQSIRKVLGEEPDIDIVSFISGLDQAASSAQGCKIAIIDTRAYSHGCLLELLQEVRSRCASLKLITVGDPTTPETLLTLIESGVSSHVHIEQAPTQLAESVRTVYTERAHISPEVASLLMLRLSELHKRLVNGSGDTVTSPEFLFELTAREQEVLTLIGEGLSNREIADQLVIEYGTAKNHVHNILTKLNVSTREEAAKLCSMLISNEQLHLPAEPQHGDFSTSKAKRAVH